MDPESYLRHVPGVIADWYGQPGQRTASVAHSTAS
ncbi:hypothetical protein AB2F22_26215 (plasmid) [Escherichia coli]